MQTCSSLLMSWLAEINECDAYSSVIFLTSPSRTSGWELFTMSVGSMSGMEDVAHMDSLPKWRVARNTWP